MSEIGYHGKVVAFDLDDTLFRERDFCRSGFRYLCSPDSYPVLDIETYPSFKELERLYNEMEEALSRRENPFDIFETFWQPIAERNGVEWDIKKHIDNYRAHSPSELPFLPEVEHTLLELRERGIRMALITDGRSVTQRSKIKALDLERFINPDLIFISEETGADKHSKEMFSMLVRHFPEASGFYYVGDNMQKDFYQPNLLGWTSVEVPEDEDKVHAPCEAPSALHLPSIKLRRFADLLQIV